MTDERIAQFLNTMQIKTTIFGGFNKRATLERIKDMSELYEHILRERNEAIKICETKIEQLTKTADTLKVAQLEEVSRIDKLRIEQLTTDKQYLEKALTKEEEEVMRLRLALQEKEKEIAEVNRRVLSQGIQPQVHVSHPAAAQPIFSEGVLPTTMGSANSVKEGIRSLTPVAEQAKAASSPTAPSATATVYVVPHSSDIAEIKTREGQGEVQVGAAESNANVARQAAARGLEQTLPVPLPQVQEPAFSPAAEVPVFAQSQHAEPVQNRAKNQSDTLRAISRTMDGMESAAKEKNDMLQELDLVRRRLELMKKSVAC